MMIGQSGIVTLLFSDLVSSTEHLQRAGDEIGQRLFQAHHKLISDAVAGTGGEELEWLGDGVLAAFSSSADAVRCAISIEQTARRPVAGARFEIRIGIHLGEVLRREGGYFGMPVVTARRLCDRAASGQILCSRMVAELLAARQTFNFRDLGSMDLKGLTTPTQVCEVVYERNDPAALLKRTPFVGRAEQLERLTARLDQACNGEGSVLMLRGEPGIGKTRTLEEFSDLARQNGALTIRGACYDGEWQAPYGPFAEAIMMYARLERAGLPTLVGKQAAIIARIAPGLRELLGDIPEPVPLDKDEERFRLFDAIAQFLIGASQRVPLVVILDDLHWADRGTVALLIHVAHFVSSNSILLIGAYRDGEVDRKHPLSGAIAAMSRQRNFDSLRLHGLGKDDLASMLGMIADDDAPDALVKALGEATDGNPLFIREVLMHLVEEGKILREGQSWISKFSIAELGIPEGVRQVVGRRLEKLSDEANRLLSVASAFNGSFSFEVAASAAGLDEDVALGAIDEALDAHLLRSGSNAESFDFSHAMIRHTLYNELNPARRVRLHRKIAEEMERAWGDGAAHHAAEVAFQFWRGAAAPGAGRGANYALAAADQAEVAYAHDEVAAFLRIALELIPANDPRRPRLLARLGMALTWALDAEESAKVAREAGDLIAATEGADAAAEYYAGAARAMYSSGLHRGAWELAQEGIRHAGDRRDIIWATLREIDLIRQHAEDPDDPGIRQDSPEQRAWRTALQSLPPEQVRTLIVDPRFESRIEIINAPAPNPLTLLQLAGEYRRSLTLWQEEAGKAESRGRITWAVTAWANVASCHVALGDLIAARAALDRAAALSARASGSAHAGSINMNVMGAEHEMRLASDDGWMELLQNADTMVLLDQPVPENRWAFAMVSSCAAYFFARLNQPEMALHWLKTGVPALERGAAWDPTYSATACDAAAALWLLNRVDFVEIVERNIREKVLPPDFRYPMRDSRLSLARLCALGGRYEEASDWFARARCTLDEQGARPLRAITDFDEAQMYLRRGSPGDANRAEPLLAAALRQFRKLGMTGWILRAEQSAATPA